MRRILVVTLLLAFAADAQRAPAQVTRDNYLDWLPNRPPIVAQTRASVTLQLFGDQSGAAYRDVEPVDGVDDSRARHLLRIAERFSPLLRRNNFSVPRHPFAVLGGAPTMQVDTWRQGQRLRSESVPMAHLAPDPIRANGGPHPTTETVVAADRVLLGALLQRFDPLAARLPVAAAEGEDVQVLFFDMPGSDPASWRRAHGSRDPRTDSRIFVHPFVHESPAAAGAARFQLVLQYWFFYPFNDAINTREGDWEHINVLVATRAATREAARSDRALMDAAEVARLLDPNFPVEDSLAIAAVDYYFHESLITIDYLELARRPLRDTSARGRHVWEDRSFIRDVVRRRTTLAGGRLATHPMVYVGGNHKGPVELLTVVPRFHGSYRRNSGGSYPLPGVWETVGPMGAAEKMYGSVVPRVRDDETLPWYALLDDEYVVHYRADAITLLPDWERLRDPVMAGDDVARQWSWMMLPVYWGFPVGASLGAGMVRHLDVGNIPPLSPPYHPSWNRIGATSRHRSYQPTVLRTPLSPTSPWSMLQSGWGVLNYPLAGVGLLPGYNIALMQLMPWAAGTMNVMGAPPGRTYTPNRLPRRFTSAAPGLFMPLGGAELARALPRRDSTITTVLRESGAEDATETGIARRGASGQRLWFNLYFHDRFALENTFAWGTSRVSYRLALPSADFSTDVRGEIGTRLLTSGVRYGAFALGGDVLQAYARGGYGWMWYDVDRMRIGQRPLDTDHTDGGRVPSFLPTRRSLPNSWYAGAGLEAFSPRDAWLLGLLGYGVRLEYTHARSMVDLAAASGRDDVTIHSRDVAFSLVFGW